MSKDEAMKLALEALEFSQKMGRSFEYQEYHHEIAPRALYALRQALKQTDTQKCVLLTPKDSIEDCFNRR